MRCGLNPSRLGGDLYWFPAWTHFRSAEMTASGRLFFTASRSLAGGRPPEALSSPPNHHVPAIKTTAAMANPMIRPPTAQSSSIGHASACQIAWAEWKLGQDGHRAVKDQVADKDGRGNQGCANGRRGKL